MISKTASFVIASALALGSTLHAEAKKPMNIVFLLADDWRFDTQGAAGNPVVQTPHLDQLSKEGVRFTEACVTTSICGVSRASIMTGQWMSRHGNRGFKEFNTPWEETYPSILRANGYYTGHIGKWHCGKFPADEFDFARSYNGKHWEKQKDGAKIHVTRKNLVDAMDFLDQRPKDRPFMLNVNFFAPHAQDGHPDQYLPQPESMKLYEDVTIPNPPLHTDEALHNLPDFLQSAKNEGRVRYHWRFDEPEKYQRMMKNYYRLCTEVDDTCGQIIERLRKEGLLENTMVIFTGDNGYFHGDRKLADKWYPYQESIKVPMIIHDPRMPKETRGTTTDEFVLNVDFAPTILSATGMAIPKGMQGRDMSPLYLPTDKSTPWRTEFFYEHGTITNKERIPSSEAVVRKDFKYTYWPEWNFEELYDLKADPLEQKNLVKSNDHQKILAELRKRHKEMAQAAK